MTSADIHLSIILLMLPMEEVDASLNELMIYIVGLDFAFTFVFSASLLLS